MGDAGVQLHEYKFAALDHLERLADAPQARCGKLDAALGVPVEGVKGHPDTPRQGLPGTFWRVEPKGPQHGEDLRLRHSLVIRDGFARLMHEAPTGIALAAAASAALSGERCE
jgi:hypothetical protein